MKKADLTELSDRIRQIGCTDVARAVKNLEALGQHPLHREAFARLLPALLDTLANIPDPDMALNNLERFFGVVIDRGFLLGLLLESPKSLDLLLTVFGSSQYLSDVLIRYPQLFAWLLEPGVLRLPGQKADLARQLASMTERLPNVDRKWDALRRFKVREILRIALQDLLGNQDLTGITQELSCLAEATLQHAYEICHSELSRRFGVPRVLDPAGQARECAFCILGMGKLGGGELNYSSDIDILFVYEAEGETTGVRGRVSMGEGRISNHEYFAKLAEMIVDVEAAQAPVFDGGLERNRRRDGSGPATLRLGAPLAKLKAARLGITAASDAIEVHGGNGYIETWPLARILRDAQVNTLWEGPDNILCLDVRRGIEREVVGTAVGILQRQVIRNHGDVTGASRLVAVEQVKIGRVHGRQARDVGRLAVARGHALLG